MNFRKRAATDMSKIDFEDQDDKPLDPMLEKVRRKMIRLQLVSAGIMIVALMAVLIAIVYKTKKVDPAKAPAQTISEVPTDGAVSVIASLPDGFTVTSMQLANGQVLFDGKTVDGTRKALVFDTRIGRIVAEIVVSKP